ncbi:hypothetical protein L596_027706 [Steinernema carpocapsae]|uniref:Uncharacterized protein n=1 Tax=Steinernema carpocapsae TaxID=34508 RepID=A0A4U5LWB4_STECR|nr:hypothetical protein L596_027706 [Steinernema carpocapsae]
MNLARNQFRRLKIKNIPHPAQRANTLFAGFRDSHGIQYQFPHAAFSSDRRRRNSSRKTASSAPPHCLLEGSSSAQIGHNRTMKIF